MTILVDFQTRQVFPLLFTSFPDLSFTIEQQTVEGTWVTTRTTLRGTHLGVFMGVAPTGKKIEIMHNTSASRCDTHNMHRAPAM